MCLLLAERHPYFGDSDPGRNSIPLEGRMQRSFQTLLSTAISDPFGILICSSGDDNLCNTPRLSPCSPPKQGKKENGPPSQTSKGRRLVFDNQLTTKSPGQRERTQSSPKQNTFPSSERSGHHNRFWAEVSAGVGLHVWDCSSKRVGSFMAAVSAAS